MSNVGLTVGISSPEKSRHKIGSFCNGANGATTPPPYFLISDSAYATHRNELFKVHRGFKINDVVFVLVVHV